MTEKFPENPPQGTNTDIDNLPEAVKNLKKDIYVLFEPGAVNFKTVRENLDLIEIDPELLENIKGAVSDKIFEIMISGHFGDLKGAKELMEKLEIEKISLPEEDLVELSEDLEKLSYDNLVRLGISQLSEMGKYDIEKAKKILSENAGYSEGELSDSKVEKILNFRHLLLALKERKINSIESLPKLLE